MEDPELDFILASKEANNELFVTNIKYNITENDLKNLFDEYGKIIFCKILRDTETNKSKGVGFIKFAKIENAIEAKKFLNYYNFKGRNIKIEYANNKYKDNNNKMNQNLSIQFKAFPDFPFFSNYNFCIFESTNNIIYLIYANRTYTFRNLGNNIIVYDLNNGKKITTIKNAHNKEINELNHYGYKNIDLILSMSFEEQNVKVWSTNNWECLYNYTNTNINSKLDTANCLVDNNQYYIIKKFNLYNEPYQVYDLKTNKIKNLTDTNGDIFFDIIFYDNNSNKNYLIFGCQGYIQSNLFGENKIYNIYKDSDDIKEIHKKIIINNKDDEIQLIDLSFMDDDNIKTIRIWNFHTKKLINKIKLKEKIFINSLCISNNKEYLIFWSNQNEIKSINIKNGKIDIISKGGAYKQLALYSWTYPAFDYVILLSVPKSEKLLCPCKFNRAATF